ncbi:hypothetical protein V3C33_16760 [Micrococcaceae bacterium Sec5.7]
MECGAVGRGLLADLGDLDDFRLRLQHPGGQMLVERCIQLGVEVDLPAARGVGAGDLELGLAPAACPADTASEGLR